MELEDLEKTKLLTDFRKVVEEMASLLIDASDIDITLDDIRAVLRDM